jgi:small subunit ribosomal protein S16
MATVIRFARHGRKKAPYFRIVVQDSRKPRDGAFIEHIGAYRPVQGASTLEVDRPRLEYWLSTGAQMSESVKNRLSVKLQEWRGGQVVARKPKQKVASPKPPRQIKEPKAKAAPATEAAAEAPAQDQPADKPTE